MPPPVVLPAGSRRLPCASSWPPRRVPLAPKTPHSPCQTLVHHHFALLPSNRQFRSPGGARHAACVQRVPFALGDSTRSDMCLPASKEEPRTTNHGHALHACHWCLLETALRTDCYSIPRVGRGRLGKSNGMTCATSLRIVGSCVPFTGKMDLRRCLHTTELAAMRHLQRQALRGPPHRPADPGSE